MFFWDDFLEKRPDYKGKKILVVGRNLEACRLFKEAGAETWVVAPEGFLLPSQTDKAKLYVDHFVKGKIEDFPSSGREKSFDLIFNSVVDREIGSMEQWRNLPALFKTILKRDGEVVQVIEPYLCEDPSAHDIARVYESEFHNCLSNDNGSIIEIRAVQPRLKHMSIQPQAQNQKY